MRPPLTARLALALTLWSLSLGLWGDPGIAVIVARSRPLDLSMGPAMLRDIYLKKVFVDAAGTALVPVNLPPDHPLRVAFSERVLNQDSEALQDYWNERYFHGVRPPYVLDSQEAVIRFVAKTEGAIGYVADCVLDASVRPVMTLTVPVQERGAVAELCGGPGGTVGQLERRGAR